MTFADFVETLTGHFSYDRFGRERLAFECRQGEQHHQVEFEDDRPRFEGGEVGFVLEDWGVTLRSYDGSAVSNTVWLTKAERAGGKDTIMERVINELVADLRRKGKQ